MAGPEWKLPPGVPRGVMDYAESTVIAEDYDDYHALNPLFEFEERVLAEEFRPLGRVADLGCGTGRALLPLVAAGHSGLAVDLSDRMLDVVREKAELSGLAVDCLRANLVELGDDPANGVADQSCDYAMCLFSTLGMIRGRDNRRRALGHMRRMLRPGGKLVLHVHNFWFNFWDGHSPSSNGSSWGGPLWVAKNLTRSFGDGAGGSEGLEPGDKFFPYRGVPNFFLHVFRPGELRADLRAANLRVTRWIPLEVYRRHALPLPWLLPSLRANGWIVVCQA